MISICLERPIIIFRTRLSHSKNSRRPVLYKMSTEKRWVTGTAKIKEMVRHCDAAIELVCIEPINKDQAERILLIGM